MAPETPTRAPWLGKLLVESLLIVLSILLALAMDSWREGRQNAARAEQALASFEAEIRRNKAVIETVMPYHLRLQKDLIRLRDEGAIRTFEDLQNIEGFEGFRPAILEETAWRTAVATGTLEHLDYETVQILSRLYTAQERVIAHSDPTYLFGATSLADENIPALVRGATFYLGDLTSGDRSLVEAYEKVLRLLEKRRGRS